MPNSLVSNKQVKEKVTFLLLRKYQQSGSTKELMDLPHVGSY